MIALLIALILALIAPFFWAMFVPTAPADVRVKFTLTTTPGKFAFAWDEHVISVCEFQERRLHRLLEFLQIPRKRCKVVIRAGTQEFRDVPLGPHWYQIVPTGRSTISFEPAKPLPQKLHGTIPVLPEGSMNFQMYNFAQTEGQRTYVDGRPLRNPQILSLWQDVQLP